MAGFLGAGALASALAGAQRRRADGQQVAWDRGMEERRLEESVLQRELARKLQERQFGLAERQFQESAADRDLAREQVGALSRERMMSAALAAQEAREARAAERERDERFRAAEAQKQREFIGTQNDLNRQNSRDLRAMAGAQQPKPRPVPNAVATAYLGNQKQIKTIDDAIAQIEANPTALGWKAYLPDAVLNRVSGQNMAGGVDARAGVSDVGSLVIHDRTGAAMSASEWQLLKGFIPKDTDDAATALKKLRRMRAIAAEETEAMADFYTPDQGYRGLGANAGAGAPPAPQGGRPRPPLNAYPGHSR